MPGVREDRHRRIAPQPPEGAGRHQPARRTLRGRGRKAVEHGKLSAEDVARITLEGVKAGRFYILPHTKIKMAIEARMKDILEDRLPTNVSFKG